MQVSMLLRRSKSSESSMESDADAAAKQRSVGGCVVVG